MRRTITVLSIVLLALAIASPARAQFRFGACATGDQEVPPPGVDSEARAALQVRFDPGLTHAKVSVRIDGLEEVAGAHFHCAPAGVNGPVAFGLIEPGACAFVNDRIECTLTNADATLVNCIPTTGQVVNNIASLRAAMAAGNIYLNVHTTAFPGGEIRGQVQSAFREGCLHGPGDDEVTDEGLDDAGSWIEDEGERSGGDRRLGRR
jgi:hypothetical protein